MANLTPHERELPITVGVVSGPGIYRGPRDFTSRYRNWGYGLREVLQPDDLNHVDAIILPGGRSDVMLAGLYSSGLAAAIKARVYEGMPIWGLCAGLVCICRQANIPDEDAAMRHGWSELQNMPLGLLGANVHRFAWGDSVFDAPISIPRVGEGRAYFAEAPGIASWGGMETTTFQVRMSQYGSKYGVVGRQFNILGTSFWQCNPSFERAILRWWLNGL